MDKVTDHLKTGYVVYNLDGVPQAIFLDGGVAKDYLENEIPCVYNIRVAELHKHFHLQRETILVDGDRGFIMSKWGAYEIGDSYVSINKKRIQELRAQGLGKLSQEEREALGV